MQNVNYGSLFLMPDTTAVIVIIAVAVAALAIGWVVGWILKDNSFKKKQGDIRRVTDKIIEAAKEESKQIKKEAILEARRALLYRS